MIVHFNQSLQTTRTGREGSRETFAELAGRVVESLATLLQQGQVDVRTLSTLRIHLDWIQYRSNFRDPVTVRRAIDAQGRMLALAEIAIDLRQVDAERLTPLLAEAQKALGSRPAGVAPVPNPSSAAALGAPVPEGDNAPVALDDFRPLRDSQIWEFNRLFWQRLADWEAASGLRFEAALPGGTSDVNHPQSVADSAGDFWTLLRELEGRGQLPAEIFTVEIGVGSGTRARLWLDRFKALDEQCGTAYYPRVKFLLGDYSPRTLDTALATMGPHAPIVSVVAMDAVNPFKTLSFLRFKTLYVHVSNVYDNLPFDELVRRDGRLYVVETRPYVSAATARHLATEFGINRTELPGLVRRLLSAGPEALDDHDRGMAFWRCVWAGLRLEERLRAIDDGDEGHVPPGLTLKHLDDLLDAAPYDIRFHLSRGAAESFANTLPLLHPRGYLQVHDIFVPAMEDYRQGFRGPGKLDGSLVAWVNGALLRAVGARAGYDVHFAPFRYRPGSKTTILFTTQRD
jgi:hypothetical protein